jgi:hypothetical protein
MKNSFFRFLIILLEGLYERFFFYFSFYFKTIILFFKNNYLYYKLKILKTNLKWLKKLFIIFKKFYIFINFLIYSFLLFYLKFLEGGWIISNKNYQLEVYIIIFILLVLVILYFNNWVYYLGISIFSLF